MPPRELGGIVGRSHDDASVHLTKAVHGFQCMDRVVGASRILQNSFNSAQLQDEFFKESALLRGLSIARESVVREKEGEHLFLNIRPHFLDLRGEVMVGDSIGEEIHHSIVEKSSRSLSQCASAESCHGHNSNQRGGVLYVLLMMLVMASIPFAIRVVHVHDNRWMQSLAADSAHRLNPLSNRVRLPPKDHE